MNNLYPSIIVLLQLVVSILQGSHGNLTQAQLQLLTQAVALSQEATMPQISAPVSSLDVETTSVPVTPAQPLKPVLSAIVDTPRVWNMQVDKVAYSQLGTVYLSWDADGNYPFGLYPQNGEITWSNELNPNDWQYKARFGPVPAGTYEFWIGFGNWGSKPCYITVTHTGTNQAQQCNQ